MFVPILTIITIIGGILYVWADDQLSSDYYRIYCIDNKYMISGNFTSLDFNRKTGADFFINNTIITESTQLFRFIPVSGSSPDSYRITSKFYGPTRSLSYQPFGGDLSFNQTNHTANSQHWYVGLRDTGDYAIMPYNGARAYLTAYNDGTVAVGNEQPYCAWCLIKDGDFIGDKEFYSRLPDL